MAETHIISGLKAKRDELTKHVEDLEYRLGKARTDLLYIEQALRVCSEGVSPIPVFMRTARLFAKGELQRMCFDMLREAPNGMDTRELAEALIARKGFEVANEPLRIAITHSVVEMLGRCRGKGWVTSDGKRRSNGVRVWRLGSALGEPA